MSIVNDIKLLLNDNTSSYVKNVIISKWGNITLADVYECYIVEQLQEELQKELPTCDYVIADLEKYIEKESAGRFIKMLAERISFRFGQISLDRYFIDTALIAVFTPYNKFAFEQISFMCITPFGVNFINNIYNNS